MEISFERIVFIHDVSKILTTKANNLGGCHTIDHRRFVSIATHDATC